MKKTETGLGAGLDRAITRLDSFYRAGTLGWLMRLYDRELGGFYCSDSAALHKGFMPDAESTYQIINLLYGGAVKGAKGKAAELMPTIMKSKISEFVLSLEDTDGGFYHPQWGKEISEARKNSDSACCKGIIEKLGIDYEPKKSEVKASKSAATAEKPRKEHLSSRNKFRAHLDGVFAASDISAAASKLKGEYKEIKDAALADVLFDYLNELQDKCGNGYFSEEVDYSAAAGLYRIGGLYNEEGREIRYAERLVFRSIALISSDAVPYSISDMHSAWGALAAVLKNIQIAAEKNDGKYNVAAIYTAVREKAPEMISKTVKKLKLFKKLGGGYSYYRNYSPAYTHGTHVSLGINEGDVNATVMAVHGVRSNIYTSLGLSVPPIWDVGELVRYTNDPVRFRIKLPIPKEFRDDAPVKAKNK